MSKANGGVLFAARREEDARGEFAGVAKLEAIRWENQYYQARATFQQQIPPS
jgi:hypothetical protein